MNTADIIRQRLINQNIAFTGFKTPAELVAYMAAMQSQDFGMAKWAIGLRLPGLTDADVEEAFNRGDILRTHVLRPTWHFVSPADIRWMLALSGPRVIAANGHMERKVELNSRIFKKSFDIIAKNLSGGHSLTRNELIEQLERARITGDGVRMAYIFMRAELDALICSGPRKGRQSTYALLEERAPGNISFSPADPLAELARRYFISRGPATLRDFIWWSGLTSKQAREALEAIQKDFASEILDGREYIFQPVDTKITARHQATFLVPDYDEYAVSYKDRSAIYDPAIGIPGYRGGNLLFNHVMAINGLVEGTYERIIKGKDISVNTTAFQPLSKAKEAALAKAVKRYIAFVKPL